MRNFLLGLVIGIVGVAAAIFCYFRFGFAPVATSSAPIPFERYLASAGLHDATSKAAGDQSPVTLNEQSLLDGAAVYRTHCAVCHGLPGRDKTAIASGMYPHPPQLLTGKGVTDDPVGVTHWVVMNGIRLTGMPSFGGSLSDQQRWEVSLLLAHAHELPPSVQDRLRQPEMPPAAVQASATKAR